MENLVEQLGMNNKICFLCLTRASGFEAADALNLLTSCLTPSSYLKVLTGELELIKTREETVQHYKTRGKDVTRVHHVAT